MALSRGLLLLNSSLLANRIFDIFRLMSNTVVSNLGECLPKACIRFDFSFVDKETACFRLSHVELPMSRIDLVSKNLLANVFRNCRKRNN